MVKHKQLIFNIVGRPFQISGCVASNVLAQLDNPLYQPGQKYLMHVTRKSIYEKT
jgi:hypothetical protein